MYLPAAPIATPEPSGAWFLGRVLRRRCPAIESDQVTPLGRAAVKCFLASLACAITLSAEASESRFLAPAAGDILASGVPHEARWISPCESERDADEMEVLLSVDDGHTFPIRLTAELPLCASSFRWKVPSVSSDHARLAVRVGRDGHAESEAIVFVSPPFRITTFATKEDSGLVGGPSEWWTEQALREIGAEGLLGGALRGSPERLEAPISDTELDVPTAAALPDILASPRQETTFVENVAQIGVPARVRRSIPLPLRE